MSDSSPGQARPIREVAESLGIEDKNLVPYGDDKAKVRLAARQNGRKPGKLILVSAITCSRSRAVRHPFPIYLTTTTHATRWTMLRYWPAPAPPGVTTVGSGEMSLPTPTPRLCIVYLNLGR